MEIKMQHIGKKTDKTIANKNSKKKSKNNNFSAKNTKNHENNTKNRNFLSNKAKNFKHSKDNTFAPTYQVTKIFKVARSEELLSFLISKGKLSRTNAKSLLTKHQVLVNGSVISQYNFMLVKDDEVKLAKRSIKDESLLVQPKQSKKQSKPKLPFEIIYQDDDIIAINKPAGMLSVESENETECAYQYLLKYFQATDKTARPFILHRIDKETSGVLIFAKNPVVHSKLKLNWNDLVKTREYIAVVEGEMEQNEGTFVSYLKQNKNNVVYSNFNSTDGQRAVTHYKVIKKNKDFSLLQVLIDTGRKNQIRVHMHDMHHPIVGDEKYGFTKNPLSRLGLHASKLEFINPNTHMLVSISAPAPKSFFEVV